MAREYNKNGNRKDIQISFRSDEDTLNAIAQYCELTNTEKSRAIRELISLGMLHYVTSILEQE